MPNFDRSSALKGHEGIQTAAERKGGTGEFTPFCPELQWKDDGDEKYVLILTPIEEAPTILLHEWVKIGTGQKSNGETYTKYEWFMSRKDPGIGEGYDELEERLDNTPRLKTLGIGVELEPVLEAGRGGRQKVVGFEVATSTYNRKGEDDETVEVVQPIIGVITQSAQNFWGSLSTFEEKQAPVIETPFQIVRRGKTADTTYDFVHFMDVPVDLSNLIDHIDGVSYLTNQEDFDEVVAESSAQEDDLDKALILADALLSTRLNELADKERYDALVKPIEHLEQRFGKKDKKGAKKESRPARPARTRRSEAKTEESAPEADVAETPAEEQQAKTEARGDRFARLRARAEGK